MGDKKSKAKAKAEKRADKGGGGGERKGVDDRPEVRAAAETLGRAREQLRTAQEAYRELRQRAEEKAGQLRGKTVGELIDGVLQAVKKRPVPSLLVAGLLGYFLGRLFRR